MATRMPGRRECYVCATRGGGWLCAATLRPTCLLVSIAAKTVTTQVVWCGSVQTTSVHRCCCCCCYCGWPCCCSCLSPPATACNAFSLEERKNTSPWPRAYTALPGFRLVSSAWATRSAWCCFLSSGTENAAAVERLFSTFMWALKSRKGDTTRRRLVPADAADKPPRPIACAGW